ncbi:MAG: hypothetical protein OEX04_16700 [Acidimicrobiia bacterium]|nr:hypothetical protein [Acidimicrobiia bacterium]MDH4309109.1 hypothetical protein [Acidimicrobiia bacterium]MDH5294032.1 hypothetical protein [Acidimicrobiia bacterium]
MDLPFAARVHSARPHDVSVGRQIVHQTLPDLPTVTTVMAAKGYRYLEAAARKHRCRACHQSLAREA